MIKPDITTSGPTPAAATGPAEHQPLSTRLEALIARHEGHSGLTLNLLIEQTEGRGLFLLIIMFCLPFVAPASVPGMSTPLGTAIALMTLGILRSHRVRLPKRVGDRVLTPRLRKVILGGGLKLLRAVEKVVKPRRSQWMQWRGVPGFHAALLILMAVLLALPLPPIPPMTNFFPSYAIIFLAASMMEDDGVMIWVGYVLALVTTAYLGWCFTVYWRTSRQVLDWLEQWARHLGWLCLASTLVAPWLGLHPLAPGSAALATHDFS